MNKTWVLTAEAFDKLIGCFDTDRERAGERYELARRMLIKFFMWRGAIQPEDYADEVINRAARRLDAGEQIEDISSYLGGIARLLLLESFKEQERQQAAFDYIERTAPTVQEAANVDDVEQARHESFERCLASLPADHRELMTKYYSDTGRARINNRQELAERLGVPLNTLRIRAHRIRLRLEECVMRSLGESA